MRKAIALIFSVLIVFPLLLSTQVVVSAGSIVLNRQFYIDTLASDLVYETIVENNLVPTLIHQGLSIPSNADTSELQSVLTSILDQDYFRLQVSSFVNNFFDYLQGRRQEFAPTIDLTPLKNAIAGEQQEAFLTALAQALPICEPGQNPGFGGAETVACKPEGVSDQIMVEDYLKPVLPLALALIPDQLDLIRNWDELQIFRRYQSLVPGMALPASLLLIGIFLVFVALSFWYITALIADNSWRVRLQWLGWTLMIPSFLVLLIGVAASGNIPVYWINYGMDRTAFSSVQFFGPGLNEALRAVIHGAVLLAAKPFLMVGGICAMLAFGLIVWGLITPRLKQDGE